MKYDRIFFDRKTQILGCTVAANTATRSMGGAPTMIDCVQPNICDGTVAGETSALHQTIIQISKSASLIVCMSVYGVFFPHRAKFQPYRAFYSV